MSDILAYFDTGQREQVGENTIWHGNGWIYDDGTLRLPVGPEVHAVIRPSGRADVYEGGERAW